MSQFKFHVELVEPPQTLTTHQNSNPNSDLNDPLRPQVSVEFVHKVNHVYYSGGDLIHQPGYDYVEIKKVAETGFDLWMVDASFPYSLIRPKLSSIGVVDPSMYSTVVDRVVLECKNALHFHYWNEEGGCKVLHVRVSIEEEKVNVLDPETNHEQEEDNIDNDDNDDDDDDNNFHVNDFNDYYGFVDEEEERVGVPMREIWIEELMRMVMVSNEKQEEDRVDDDDDDDFDDDDYGFVVEEVEVRVMVPRSEASIDEMLKRVRVGDESVCTICLEEFNFTSQPSDADSTVTDHETLNHLLREYYWNDSCLIMLWRCHASMFPDDCIVKWLNMSHYRF